MSQQISGNDFTHPIIAVTGTKGKTSIVRLLDFVLQAMDQQVLRVDTSGAYMNSVLHYSDDDSRRIWGYAVTNAPGRFISLHGKQKGTSVLECTLFSAMTGLAYKRHDVGIFTNVYEDHIGAFPHIRSPEDIAKMKSFIFSKIRTGGTAIFNADDPQVVAQLSKVRAGVLKVAVTLRFDMQADGWDYICTVDGGNFVIKTAEGTLLMRYGIEEFKWLKSAHTPSVYNALFVIAALLSFMSQSNFVKAINALKKYKIAEDGGRLVEFSIKNGPHVIVDFAHEKVSLKEVALYAGTLCAKDGKIIGVLRLAPSRADKLIKETAEYIYNYYDEFIIYDKIDGYYRKPKTVKGYNTLKEQEGAVAALFSGYLKENGIKKITTVLREDIAIQSALGAGKKGDVIVYIAGDDTERSLRLLKGYTQEKENTL